MQQAGETSWYRGGGAGPGAAPARRGWGARRDAAAAGLRGSAGRQTLPLPLQNPQYEIKDGAGTLHSGIAQPATYYSYDHSLGQYQYDR